MKRMLILSLTLFFAGCVDNSYDFMNKYRAESRIRVNAHNEWIAQKKQERYNFVASNDRLSKNISSAILNKILIKGMTLQEAKMTFNECNWELSISHSSGYEVWHIYECTGFNYYSYSGETSPSFHDSPNWTATFINGSLDSWAMWG